MSENFEWVCAGSGLIKSEFHALANLLSLRNGGQVEPASLLVDPPEDEGEADDDNASMDWATVQQLSDSGYQKPKKKFLDCLAEFAANKRGGKSVACTAMKELEDSVAIWISRNTGFSPEEGGGDIVPVEDNLWKEMVLYHQERIEKDYIPDLRASFKAYDAKQKSTTNAHVSNIDVLETLRALAFAVSCPGKHTIERHDELVTAAYELQTRGSDGEPQNWRVGNPASEKVWNDNDVNNPSPPPITASMNPLEDSLNLKQVFNLLSLPFNLETVGTMIGQRWSMNRIEHEFSKRQKQKFNVHAEVQMLLFFNMNEHLSRDVILLPYFGCSKLSCFMCAHLLRSHGTFSTRGCHGRLFKPWTVPDTTNLKAGHASRIALALVKVQKDVRKELKLVGKGSRRQEKTSVIGGSSIVSNYKAEGSQRQVHKQQRKLKAEQDRAAEMFRRNQHGTPHSEKYHQLLQTLMILTNVQFAPGSHLGDVASATEAITAVRFARASGLDTISSIVLSVHLPLLIISGKIWRSICYPTTRTFCKTLGLTTLPLFRTKPNFSGYTEDFTFVNIKEFFYQIPERSQGGYFPWFLNHTEVLDRPVTTQEATLNTLQTEAKSDCFVMVAQILYMASPNPIERGWYRFGFCTCIGEREEGRLGGLYQQLLVGHNLFEDVHSNVGFSPLRNETATFAEFWHAYEAGTLIKLMDSKGLENLRSGFTLKDFSPSHLRDPNPPEYPPMPALEVDYGFMNCKTFEETCILMEIYKRLLEKANPLDLHQACLAGKLFEFAKKYHTMDKDHRRLMRNFYPLAAS
ncbi:uncharacterized protein PAC_11226 [Phialocephala subalpina]|uniref:Uncharacterized protein n=1 Tax=Phialocephala subalpina TaxID=576137 RepID=A0A1L7X8I8_9HELO|nr:uncharacterized protein PAC_11226 [Phialocephala subalpina]